MNSWDLKRRAVTYLGGCCELCGYTRCLAALDFHHEIPEEKSFLLSVAFGDNRPWEEIRRELMKCRLLCSNCHRELHYAPSVSTIRSAVRETAFAEQLAQDRLTTLERAAVTLEARTDSLIEALRTREGGTT